MKRLRRIVFLLVLSPFLLTFSQCSFYYVVEQATDCELHIEEMATCELAGYNLGPAMQDFLSTTDMRNQFLLAWLLVGVGISVGISILIARKRKKSRNA